MDNFGGEWFKASQYVWCNVCMCEMCIFYKRVCYPQSPVILMHFASELI